MPAAAVIRGMRALSGFIGWVRRRQSKSAVKYRGSTPGLPMILFGWDTSEAGGMCGVAVKCIDIAQNTDCGGIRLGRNRR